MPAWQGGRFDSLHGLIGSSLPVRHMELMAQHPKHFKPMSQIRELPSPEAPSELPSELSKPGALTHEPHSPFDSLVNPPCALDMRWGVGESEGTGCLGLGVLRQILNPKP